jgi:RNA polymerase sigma-70 factor (ECF subfamily)
MTPGSAAGIEPLAGRSPGAGSSVRGPDAESRSWLALLRSEGEPYQRAVGRLHGILLRAARFEVSRRQARTPHLRGDEAGDIALQAADDALIAVLRRLDSYRGDSRFTTWAYKFALLEAAVAVRRRAWQGRELPVADERWSSFGAPGPSAQQRAESNELLAAIHEAIDVLSDRQREVFTALALNEVPIDVLAERLATTRGALYTSLHDARRKIREELGRRGLDPSAMGGTA